VTTPAEAPAQLLADIRATAAELREPLREFVRRQQIDLLIVENAFAIPMNLPLAVALTDLIAELDLKTIAHNHDFYWERQRYQNNAILELLDTVFPPDLPSVRHVTINSIAQRRFKRRRGVDSVVVPNVHDFATPPPEVDPYAADLRAALGLSEADVFILQPTRVIQRKGIELALELVHCLDRPGRRLFITHSAGDEGLAYWQWLQHEAAMLGVDLRLVADLIGPERAERDGRKIYSLWDAYPHADLVTYPSLVEGFGNALLEAIYFKRPVVVNRYAVYNADIGPLGFEFVELDGFVNDAAVGAVKALLADPGRVQTMVEKNYALAEAHFSYAVLERKLAEVIESF
jgi:glycosyltransferase involved in cell wall biosynthesis